MEWRVRNHVPAVTALLTVVSLALVFSAALGAIPSWVLPHAPPWLLAAIPHLNAGLSLLAIGTIAAGWRAIRRGDVRRHRRAMLSSLGLFGTFLALYLYRVGLEGPTPFPGPTVVHQYVFLPILVVHVSLAVVCIPLLYYVVLLGLTRPAGEVPLTRHPRVGRVAASLWLVSFSLGVLVYLLLYVAYGPVV